MRIAAVQMNAVFADVKANIRQSENLIRDAVLAGAELVLLPEFFTSAIGFSKQMLDVAVHNKQVQALLKQWANDYQVIIGGSYISFDGNNAFNLFALVFPNGEAYEHKKDIPTQFENCYYTNGDENNILKTPIGNIGVSLCWEMIRYDTVKRLLGKADIVLSGSCWWDLPKDAAPDREPLRKYNQKLALDTPVTFAKLLCVPVVHSNHCGEVTAFSFPKADKKQTRQLVGAAQIIDSNGNVNARRHFYEGGGFVISDVKWSCTDRKKTAALPSEYWIPDLPDSYISAWESANPLGKHYYETVALPYYKAQLVEAVN